MSVLRYPTIENDAPPSRVVLVMQLVGVVLICLGVRVWLVSHTEVIARDGTRYIEAARTWTSQPAEATSRYDFHMGYPIAVATTHGILSRVGIGDGLGRWELSGQLVSVIASTLAVVAVWVFATMVFNHRIAWVSVLLFGVGRKWAGVGSDVLTDGLCVAMQMWAVVFAILTLRKLQRGKWGALVLSAMTGLCAGAGYLVRPEAMLILAPGVFLWGTHTPSQGRNRVLVVSVILIAVLCAAACGAPYMMAIGGFTKKSIFQEIGAGGIPSAVKILAASGFSMGRHLAVREFLNKLFEALNPIVGVLLCVWLATCLAAHWVGFALPRRIRSAFTEPLYPGVVMMVGMGVLLVPLVMVRYIATGAMSHRYVMVLAALLSPLGGAGGMILAESVAIALNRVSIAIASRWVVCLTVAMLLVVSLIHTLQPLHKNKTYYRRTAEFVGKSKRPTDVILTDSRWISHYGRIETIFLHKRDRDFDVSRFTKRILDTRATHLVLSDRTVTPPLKPLLTSPAFIQLKEFVQDKRDNPDRIRIYRTVMPFFDEKYYLGSNAPVRRAVAEGVFPCGFYHYVVYGIREGRNPSKFFDEKYYLARNPDVERAVREGLFRSPIEHYILFGAHEGRRTSEWFDERYYLNRYEDVREAVQAGTFLCALEHYLLCGRFENRQPLP